MRGGQYLSVYLRQRFQLTNRDRIRGLELRVRANDGYIAYLNGREVDRMHSGAPGEAQAFNAPAYVAMETPKRLVTWRIAIPAASLREGENLLALHGTSRIEGEEHDFALHPSLHGFTVLDDEARRRARQMLDEFLAASPTEPARAAYFEGRVLQLDGESEKAEVFFQRARALEPGSPEPYLRIAECLRSRDRGEEGTRVLREAIRSGLHRHEILWDAWFAGQLEKAPGQILEDFPLRQADEDPLSPKPDPGKDLQWLLERFAAGKPAHIDCGAMASSVVEGVQWSRDRFYRGGWDWYIGGEAVRRDPGLVPDVPYATLRHFFNPPERFPAYRFPLLRGWYRVTFYFMEGEPKTDDWLSGPFDVLLEGQTRIENYDPRRAARVWVPDTQEVEVEVVDGFLDVEIRRRSSAKRMPSFMGMTLERRE
jgi:tetratricopeptide (TPR) repeat protein